MASRLYLSDNAGALTPNGWQGGWTVTNDPENVGTKSCNTTKQNTSLVTSGAINAPGVSGNTSAVGRWISPPLKAQTINSGTTLTGYLRCNENTSTANVTLAIYIGLVNAGGSAGSTVIALAASDSTSTPPEMGTALASRQWLNASEASPSVSGNVSVTKGQRLVIEVGARFSNTVTSRGAYFRYGDASANDFTSAGAPSAPGAPVAAPLAPTSHRVRGATVRVRPMRREDLPTEADFVRHLSSEARYKRFMLTLRELSPAKLKYLTDVDQDRHVALVATVDRDGHELEVGVVRYAVDPAGTSAEFAIAVDDEWQGSGLAGILMHALVDVARARGLATMEGIVLRANHRMLRFARQLGFEVRPDPEDPQTMRVVRALR